MKEHASGVLVELQPKERLRPEVHRRHRAALGRNQLRSNGAKLCSAAKWLGIITVEVLPVAGSVGSILDARAQFIWRMAVLATIVGGASCCSVKCVGTRARGGQMSIGSSGAIDGRGTVRVRANINSFSGLQTARACIVVIPINPALYS